MNVKSRRQYERALHKLEDLQTRLPLDVPDPSCSASDSEAGSLNLRDGLTRVPLAPKRWPRPPEAFRDGQGRLPNNPIVAAGLQAIWKGGRSARQLLSGWAETEHGHVMHRYDGAKGGRIWAFPVFLPDDPEPTVSNYWKYVESLTPLTADVVFAVLAQLVEPSMGDKPKQPLLQPVPITTEAILRYKGIQRWGDERADLEQRIFEEMEKLRMLTFNVEQLPAYNPRVGRTVTSAWQGDRLFDIVKVERHEHPSGKRLEVAWSVRAGQWAYYWLNAQGRVLLAHLAQVLLEWDHQGKALAKKLGQRLVLLANAVTRLRSLRIDHLLEDVGELPAPEHRDHNWAGRTRDRFDEAMLVLEAAGIFTAVEWPEGHGPGDSRRDKGWVATWLNAHIRITLPEVKAEAPVPLLAPIPGESAPPEPVEDGPEPPAPEPPRGPAPPPGSAFDTARLRKVRQSRGWKQDRLARELGVSRTYLSLLESGKSTPSDELVTRITTWLNQPTPPSS